MYDEQMLREHDAEMARAYENEMNQDEPRERI